MRNSPSGSVCALVRTLVAVSVIVTVAPGMAAPLSSTTRPEMDPRVVCAFAGKVTNGARTAAAASQTNIQAIDATRRRLLTRSPNSATDVVVISKVLPFSWTLSHKAWPLRMKPPIRNQKPHRFGVIARPETRAVVKGMRPSNGIHVEFNAQSRPAGHIHAAVLDRKRVFRKALAVLPN